MEKTVESYLPKVIETRCNCCSNKCKLNVLVYPDGRRFISGNHCSKPIGKKAAETYEYDIYEYKRALLRRYMDGKKGKGKRGTLGLPMSLSMYEYLPFFHTLFSSLGFDVTVSPFTTSEMLEELEWTSASSSACISSRLLKAHVEYLKRLELDYVFIPAVSSVSKQDRVYQCCPISAYTGDVLQEVEGKVQVISALMPFDKDDSIVRRIASIFDISKKEVLKAYEKAVEAEKKYRKKLNKTGASIAKKARKDGRRMVIISSRSYYLDPVIFHDIDKMLLALGYSVLSDDSISKIIPTTLDNSASQWFAHSRMHDAARVAASSKDMSLLLLKTPACTLDPAIAVDTRAVLKKRSDCLLELEVDEKTTVQDVFAKLLTIGKTSEK